MINFKALYQVEDINRSEKNEWLLQWASKTRKFSMAN